MSLRTGIPSPQERCKSVPICCALSVSSYVCLHENKSRTPEFIVIKFGSVFRPINICLKSGNNKGRFVLTRLPYEVKFFVTATSFFT